MQEGYNSGKIQRDLFDEYELEYLDALLLQHQFAEKLERQKQSIAGKQQELFDRIRQYPYCVIFSAGSHGSNLQIMLKQNFHKDIAAFCDNDVLKHGLTVNGVEIVSPDRAEQDFPGAVYMIANKKYALQIQRQLEEMQIETCRIINCKVEELIYGFM